MNADDIKQARTNALAAVVREEARDLDTAISTVRAGLLLISGLVQLEGIRGVVEIDGRVLAAEIRELADIADSLGGGYKVPPSVVKFIGTHCPIPSCDGAIVQILQGRGSDVVLECDGDPSHRTLAPRDDHQLGEET